jgi:hypothetical protein
MMHEDPVLCLTFSVDSELLATGSSKGEVKVRAGLLTRAAAFCC